ncbi:MAG: hypothetical protein KAT46_01765 [Deltaproteobacteria bacterium]|nr:hypothetical protein [Deltaproteobacteria bacterium]
MKPTTYKYLIFLFCVTAIVAFTTTWQIKEAQAAGAKPTLDPSDPKSSLYLDSRGKLAGTGSSSKPVSEAFKAGQGWHPQALQSEGLPKDRYGLVDWAKLVNDGSIEPLHSLDEDEDELPPLDVDVVIHSKGDYVKDVKYPHQIHTYWLSCENCHPAIFEMGAGANPISMVEIAEGKWCGRCHGKVAFPLADCNRCHTIPKKAKR